MSLSSTLLTNITAFRNPNGPEQTWTQIQPKFERIKANPWKVFAAELGYIAVIPVAIVETALSAIAKIFSALLPIGKENHQKMTNWLRSSSFSVLWALGDAAINPCCNDLIQTEKVARACAASGDIFTVPAEALSH